MFLCRDGMLQRQDISPFLGTHTIISCSRVLVAQGRHSFCLYKLLERGTKKSIHFWGQLGNLMSVFGKLRGWGKGSL